jgi:IclR family pca regulon transcriptional regulator
VARLRAQDALKRKESSRGPDFSEALARGLSVIRVFSPERPQMTMSDIAREVDLPRATARRAIHTLESLGFLEAEGRLYRLTPKVLELATAYLSSNLISTVLQPICDRISRSVGEACSTAVLEGEEVVMISHAAPRRLIEVGPGVGFRLPAHCTALGRVLLAALAQEQLEDVLARVSLAAATPHTVTDKVVLRSVLAQVREQQYALVDQEAEAGFRSIAAPIRRYDGKVVAAINIGARIEAVSKEVMLESYLPLLRREVEQLSRQLV